MSRLKFFLSAASVLIAGLSIAQESNDDQQGKEYARKMKEIVFQNDSQWEDNRWQKTDVGPFLGATIKVGKSQTLKGIGICVGDEGEAGVCFDTARMRYSAGWTGGFLKFGPRRFGLIAPPEPAGEVFFSTTKLAGWAKGDRFKPEPSEISGGIESPGNRETRLPKGWTWFKGHYTHANRVVLSYSVGECDVLESPWFAQVDGNVAFIRSLEMAPSTESLCLLVADSVCRLDVIGDADFPIELKGKLQTITVPPHEQVLRLKVLITDDGINDQALAKLRMAAGQPDDLAEMIKNDSGRWPQVLETQGETSEYTDSSYVVDTLTLPFENPWNALLFTAGHDFFSDGSAAICTAHGDVWTVSGIDQTLKRLKWRRFATGLHQPLGLKIVDDKVHVIGRGQVTKLHDRNGDGEADFYENFNNDLQVAPRAHDYVTCLDTDPEGNFYFIHAATGVMKLTADGSTLTSVADGFRNPNGMGVSPTGVITAAPQQGQWTPESSLIVVNEGGYYGYGGPRTTADRPTGWDLPMCFIPRAMDNSGGGQVWVEGNRWGQLEGKMLHLSYGKCRMLLALTEDADGIPQGGTIEFPTAPGDFESGAMRGRFSPSDGQLYVSGLRGWQTRAIRDGCFQRVRYTGGPMNLPVNVETFTNGIKLKFATQLNPEFVQNPGNYFAEQWNYVWSKAYGSPDFSVENPTQQGRDEVVIESATLMDNGYSVFLEMPERIPVNQLQISWLMESKAGHKFRGKFAHTINNTPSATMPESILVRRERPRYISEEVEARLKPGLDFAFQSRSSGDTDHRVERLVAFHQSIAEPPSPFLPSGPFSLMVNGTLEIPLSGFYDFKIEGAKQAQFWINNELIVNASASEETTEPILLHKGHNRIRINYTSPDEGNANLRLLWKDHRFGWEPVPPSVFFHDRQEEGLVAASLVRRSRELFADHRCSNCHDVGVSDPKMFELTLGAPDLSEAGERFGKTWLYHWMLSPNELRLQSHMPAVLGTGEKAAQAAADIAAYLVDEQETESSLEVDSNHADKGEVLFEDLACITCHHFGSPETGDDFERLSLHFAHTKYRPKALQSFLMKPSSHHASIRMPDFRLTEDESEALSHFIRQQSVGKLEDATVKGDPNRGQALYAEKGCQNCHGIQSKQVVIKRPTRKLDSANGGSGCLADSVLTTAPKFSLSSDERKMIADFVKRKAFKSLEVAHAVETSQRLFGKLQCANCHDRDGQRSHRALALVEDGSGKNSEVLPELTWSGEKLKSNWTQKMLAGELDYKSRPWLKTRMPAFPAYAKNIAYGFAKEHGLDPSVHELTTVEPEMVEVGQQLTLQTGLDCRQCHAVGSQQPRGDKNTKIALGINLNHVKDRMRREAYHRFMLDPPRYDIKTSMIRLSENGKTTKLKKVFDADAQKQFEAVWQYIQSLQDDQKNTNGGLGK